ncbi:PopZ family protein [Pseudochrobactrum sp. HB0163]|uniref:PopZ family protein n=1 Tax=Pseudochrobactrum sp. HB0163 TaxID=3450708 RepID=UPI003F6E0084
MAQTSSVTREPSMEEILASIRRIIEDSDVTKQAAADLTAAPANRDDSLPQAAQRQTEETEKRGEVTRFPRPVQAVDDIPAAPSSFALDAVLRGTISEPSSFAASQEESSKPANNAEQDRAAMHERNVAHVRIATVNPPVPPVVAAAKLPESTVTRPSEALLMHVARQRVATQQGEGDANAFAAKQEEIQMTDHQSPKAFDKPLISRAAEEQVAASFGSLSQALLDEQKRLLNEKMEAMLRPMLQEWLDTNLPPLVERLVREEIERVVRRG